MIQIAMLSLLSASYLFCVNGGVINGTPAADLAGFYASAVFGTLWIRRDSRESGYWPADHYGFWVLSIWPLLVPHYFYKTRGRHALSLVLLFYGLLWLPVLAGWAGWIFYEDLPDFR